MNILLGKNLQTYRELKELYTHLPDSTINILLSVHLSIYPSIHLSINPSNFLVVFQSKLQTSVPFPPNTSACMSLTEGQYLFIAFFFPFKVNLHTMKYTNLNVPFGVF